MLREFFEVNMLIVLFGYGLVFFLLGFAITLQARHESRFTLARSLPLLGTFGLLHGIAEWGHVFIPIQSLYLSEPIIMVLRGLATTLLSLAFVALFSFGARLLADTTGRHRWLTWLPSVLFAIWFGCFLIVWLVADQGEYEWWLKAGDLWSRYLLAFLGALLTCYALTLQADEFRAREMEGLLHHLRVGVFSFALFAVAGGLLVPESSFFPANVLNSEVFFMWTGLPVQIPRAIAGLFMAYSIVRILEIFDIESARRLEEAERSRAVWEERDRIARELHDGIIQSLYAVGLSLENAQYLAEVNPQEAREQVATVMKSLNRAIRDIRSYIMDLKETPGLQKTLPERMQALVSELSTNYHRPIDLTTTLHGPVELSEEAMNHVRQIVREAVANAIRHGEASRIAVHLEAGPDGVGVQITDNGKGFNPENPNSRADSGLGLANMARRAELLGGSLTIESEPGAGASVKLRFAPNASNRV